MSGPSLASMQRQFLAHIRGCSGAKVPAAVAQGRLSGPIGVGIYINAYGARLREALENDHSVLATYLGDNLWEQLCRGYIAAHPSRYRSLRQFGASLPEYLGSTAPFLAHPTVAGLATFELALLDCFDAADAACAEWNELPGLQASHWPDLRLCFHPSFRLLGAANNSVEIWQAIKAGQTPPAACAAVNAGWALYRDAESVTRFRSVNAEEYAVAGHAARGSSFASICERLTDWHSADVVPGVALGYLHSWCAEGWLSGWEFPSPPPD